MPRAKKKLEPTSLFPKLNEPLIEEVLAHITKFPLAYQQFEVVSYAFKTKKTPCGSVGCFGGWGVLLGMPKEKRRDFAKKASKGDDDVDILMKAEKLFGFTQIESNFVFAAYGYSSEASLEELKKRLAAVRKNREETLNFCRSNLKNVREMM